MAKEFYNIEYIPTGLVYSMHKVDVDRLVTEEPENFRVVDEDYKKPVEPQSEPTIFEQVVVKEKEVKEPEEEIADVDYSEYSLEVIKNLCTEQGIKFNSKTKKEKLVEELKKKLS